MNFFASGGMLSGIIFGLIISVIVFKFANTNRKAKTDYDERQKVIRGNAYRVSFYSLIAYEVIMMLLSLAEVKLPWAPYMTHAAAILLSCTVLACYCILKDVYWGLNNNRRRYFTIFAVLAVINVLPVIMAAVNGELIENGKFSSVLMNLLAALMILAMGICFLIRNRMDSGEE